MNNNFTLTLHAATGGVNILNYTTIQNLLAVADNVHNLDLNSSLSVALTTAPSFE